MAARTPSLNTKAFHSMRDWIAYLEQTKRLVRAKKGVPLKYTLAAIAKQLDGDKAFQFSKLKCIPNLTISVSYTHLTLPTTPYV